MSAQEQKAKSLEELYGMMIDTMPFELSDRIKPYIIELAKAYANEKLREASDKYFTAPNGFRELVGRDTILNLIEE